MKFFIYLKVTVLYILTDEYMLGQKVQKVADASFLKATHAANFIDPHCG